jgi:hypothetical protein
MQFYIYIIKKRVFWGTPALPSVLLLALTHFDKLSASREPVLDRPNAVGRVGEYCAFAHLPAHLVQMQFCTCTNFNATKWHTKADALRPERP